MPKRCSDSCRTVKPRRQHLYLVLDDGESGCSIFKVDLSRDSEGPGQQVAAGVALEGATSCPGEQRLPPLVFRVQAQRGAPMQFAAAFGTVIFVYHPKLTAIDGSAPLMPWSFHPAFDVRTRSIFFIPRQEPDPVNPIFIPVGRMLFSLGSGTFQRLDPPPLKSRSHIATWSWLRVSELPFEISHVTSYAVHPDGRTIFVSIIQHSAFTTFTFDTADKAIDTCCKWKPHGQWVLPFTSHAHFDRSLDAWVGLPRDPGAIGHICSCRAVSPDSHAKDEQRLVPLNLSKEKLFSEIPENPAEKHVGATLVYMGGRSNYCLVECISVPDDCFDERNGGSADEMDDCNLEAQDVSQPRHHLFRLTTFSLGYDQIGYLTTGHSCQVRQYYKVPQAVSELILKNPVAFWM